MRSLSAAFLFLCVALRMGDVLVVPHGYFVQSRELFIHYGTTQISGDSRYWLCTANWIEYVLYVPNKELPA